MIGREEEIKYLRSLKSEEESQFIALRRYSMCGITSDL